MNRIFFFPRCLKDLFPTWAKLRVSEVTFCSIRSSGPVQGGITPKAKEWTPVPQLINITSILTNGRPASQTVRPLGHKAGVCPGALRTLSGPAQVPSVFLCTALAPTSHVSLLSRLGRASWASTEDLFFKTDLHGRMYLNSQTLEFDGKQQKVRGKTGKAFKSK